MKKNENDALKEDSEITLAEVKEFQKRRKKELELLRERERIDKVINENLPAEKREKSLEEKVKTLLEENNKLSSECNKLASEHDNKYVFQIKNLGKQATALAESLKELQEYLRTITKIEGLKKEVEETVKLEKENRENFYAALDQREHIFSGQKKELEEAAARAQKNTESLITTKTSLESLLPELDKKKEEATGQYKQLQEQINYLKGELKKVEALPGLVAQAQTLKGEIQNLLEVKSGFVEAKSQEFKKESSDAEELIKRLRDEREKTQEIEGSIYQTIKKKMEGKIRTAKMLAAFSLLGTAGLFVAYFLTPNFKMVYQEGPSSRQAAMEKAEETSREPSPVYLPAPVPIGPAETTSLTYKTNQDLLDILNECLKEPVVIRAREKSKTKEETATEFYQAIYSSSSCLKEKIQTGQIEESRFVEAIIQGYGDDLTLPLGKNVTFFPE